MMFDRDELWADVFRAGLRPSDSDLVVRFTAQFARDMRNRVICAALSRRGATPVRVAAIFGVSAATVRRATIGRATTCAAKPAAGR